MSGSRYDRPSGVITLLLLLAAFAFASGCSSANTEGTAGGANHIDASGKSVPGWLVLPSGGQHAVSATQNYIASGGSAACAECHGTDLSGGISRVSCFANTAGCHHGPVAGWVTTPPAAQEHGASAKRAPGSSGFASCQICHGASFSEGPQVACSACHGVAAPHPAAWRGVPYTHADTNTANAPVCSRCHFPGSANNPANHPATPAPAGTAPGCFNNTLCHGESAVPHPVGNAWVTTSPADQPHAAGAKAVASSTAGFSYCQTCHGSGTDFAGGSSTVSCYTCHGASAPHAASPWRASAGSTYTHTNTAETGNAAVCAFCHFPGSPNNPANHPATPAPPGTAPGCFNSTLCHGSTGAAHDVPYNDNTHYNIVSGTFAGACGACHDLAAPSTKSGPACDTCHAAGSPLTALNCTSCHASPPDGSGPAGAAYPNLAGAHSVHIALNAAGSPVACNTCHNGLGSRTLNHYSRAKNRTAPGDAAFPATYNAESGASAFDNSAALTCSNISCHGGQTTPNWRTGAIDVNNQCTVCHASGTAQFNSYFSGDHGEHIGVFGTNATTCKYCHNTTALAASHFGALATPAMEGPASATVGGTGTFVTTYVPATGSCSPTTGVCHGTRTW